MTSTKTFYFNDDKNNEQLEIIIKQLYHPSYGCYVWPSSFVLAEYIWNKRNLFKDKTILELGSGTSLPGYLCALLSSESLIILTDDGRSNKSKILQNISDGLILNDLSPCFRYSSPTIMREKTRLISHKANNNNVWIRDLIWGEFCSGKDGGLLNILNDLETCNKKIDWILGSDTFYDPKDKWNLEAKLIPLKSFDFNFEKYTVDIPMETVVEDEIGGKDHIRSLQSIFLIEINNKKQSKNNKK
ncbi:4945_t:CDS:2 [Entrophospora sp. SA101]|nr:13708_t:CDS:2 [Entrophospora sp. SA101]CAJ0752992.1 4943_t:CDS:2 [Entrophospora sp. SA101]CAJ0752994.1 4945_t:CDS:2 [Entrophospora sp. SA101]CAJ0851821.1 9318_t:CDS:2 [Entrophospora sp. SA101]